MEADGTLTALMKAGTPVIERMRADYYGMVCDASFDDGPDWRTSSEFFGRGVIPRKPHTEPRGRYADRRRTE